MSLTLADAPKTLIPIDRTATRSVKDAAASSKCTQGRGGRKIYMSEVSVTARETSETASGEKQKNGGKPQDRRARQLMLLLALLVLRR